MPISVNEAADYVFVSVNPDLQSPYGHTLHMDRRLRDAVEADGGQFLSLAHKSFRPELESDKSFIHNVFSHPSSNLLSNALPEHIICYANELQASCKRIADAYNSKSVVIFQYMGHLQHLVGMHLAAQEFPEHFQFLVDLYAGLFPKPAPWAEHLLQTFQKTNRIHVCADSEETISWTKSTAQMDLPLLPFCAISDWTSKDLNRIRSNRSQKSGPITVFYPSYASKDRGFDLLLTAISGLVNEDLFLFRLRTGVTDLDSLDPEIARMIRELESAENVEFIPGVLSTEEYRAAFETADLIVTPYRSSAFGTRTSGIFPEALSIETPIVVTQETWAGELTESLGCGATFHDGDSEGLRHSLTSAAENLVSLRETTRETGKKWLSRNSPANLIQFVKSLTLETKPIASSSEVSDQELQVASQWGIEAAARSHFEPMTDEFALVKKENQHLKGEQTALNNEIRIRDEEIEKKRLQLSDRAEKMAKLKEESQNQKQTLKSIRSTKGYQWAKKFSKSLREIE